jgi:phosphoglycerate dehydrogenase-like enzyme
MKRNVLSLVPHRRFTESDTTFPAELEFSFKEAAAEDEIIAACHGIDFLMVPPSYPPIKAGVLDNIPSVRMIQSAGAGYNNVDTKRAARLNLPVANSPGVNTTTVAEYTVALIIALQRQMLTADREIKAGNYSSVREQLFTHGLKEICDLHLGLIGLGAIGRKVAQVVGLLGAPVSYYDVMRPEPVIEEQLNVTYKDIDELLGSSDAVSVHAPLTKHTYNLIGERELGLMAPGAIFINTARGEIVDPAALAGALESGHLGAAAIDTISPEPPPPDHPLLNLSEAARDRLLITPHIAGTTKSAFQRMLNQAIENIARVAAGDPPKHVVNGVLKERAPLG